MLSFLTRTSSPSKRHESGLSVRVKNLPPLSSENDEPSVDMKLKNVSFAYTKNNDIIKGLDLKLYRGKINVLLGANSSGKTTALKVAAGVLKAHHGKVKTDGKGSYKDEQGEWVAVGDNTPVSMNVWGFTPDYFQHSEEYFKEFLSDPKNMENKKAEFFIPLMVNKLINEGTATVKVLDTTSKWFGVTYAADRQSVVDKIQSLIDEGVYPNKLF